MFKSLFQQLLLSAKMDPARVKHNLRTYHLSRSSEVLPGATPSFKQQESNDHRQLLGNEYTWKFMQRMLIAVLGVSKITLSLTVVTGEGQTISAERTLEVQPSVKGERNDDDDDPPF